MNLERLASLWNKKWPDDRVNFLEDMIEARGGSVIFVPSKSDSWNAFFIILCLDRLEELGEAPNLYSNPFSVSTATAGAHEGSTRAEACALALLAALEGE